MPAGDDLAGMWISLSRLLQRAVAGVMPEGVGLSAQKTEKPLLRHLRGFGGESFSGERGVERGSSYPRRRSGCRRGGNRGCNGACPLPSWRLRRLPW